MIEDLLKPSYTKVTAFTAAIIAVNIKNLYLKTPKPSKILAEDWKHHLDGCATIAMETMLNKTSYESISVGSEGAKEKNKAGKEAPSLANQNYGIENTPKTIIMSDVLEGTTFASQNLPGASSTLAAYLQKQNEFGIKPSSDKFHYLYKFFGPSQANGIIDPLKSHTENLKNLIDALNLKDPKELIQITLNPNRPGRECNREIVQEAENLGVDVRLIEHGDFIASLRAISQPTNGHKYAIVVGKGGYEEGIMNVVAARAIGAFSQIQYFDTKEMKTLPEVLETNDLVSKEAKRSFVFNSFVTDENLWFNQPGVKLSENKYEVTSLVVTEEGLQFRMNRFDREPIEKFIFEYGTFNS